MRIYDLSMPIWEGAAYGEILPFTNSPVRFVEYMVYERHGMRRTLMKLDRETGSPLITSVPDMPYRSKSLESDPRYRWTLDQIPLDRLVLRDTTVLDVPAAGNHEITAAEIDRALREADYRQGDQVLIRTGWGTTERAYEMGSDYYLAGPSLHYEAGLRLAEALEEMDTSVVLTDCGLVNPPRVQGHDWFTGDAAIVPLPKPFPSAEARERALDLGGYVHANPEPSSFGAMIRKAVAICKCLVDCHQIRGKRVKTVVLPLLIQNGGAGTARVFALED